MSGIKIGLAGGFGGIAPSLIDKAEGLQSGEVAKWLADGKDILIPVLCSVAAMAVFFAIGCIVAVIYKETVLSKAMILGIGAPALIMAAAAAGSGKPEKAELGGLLAPVSVIGSAFAQDNSATEKAFDLTVKSTPDGGDCIACSVQILGVDKKLLATQTLNDSSGETVISVPEGASSIIFSGDSTNAVSLDVQQITGKTGDVAAKPVIDVERNRNYWNDVQRTLGARSVQPYDFKLQVER